MSGVSYFRNAKDFVVKDTNFNTYVSGVDALQFLYQHAATGAMHDSDERYPPPLCHPGTREVVIVRIKDWYGFQTRPNKPIMWIHAPAGYGKTAIAGTISKILEEVEGLDFSPLGATFYFWRTSPGRDSPAHFIITIAYQLAISIPELAPHIENAIKRNPMVLRKALEVQLMKLIVEPFKALGELEDMPNRLVIIDGLDECINSDQECRVKRQYAEDQENVQIRILDLIHTLQSHHLPLSFLIFSRPEEWIKQHIQSASFERVVEVVDLYALGDHLQDTERYIRAELSRIVATINSRGEPDGEDEWPGEGLVRTFVNRTDGHMLYATTVIRHIDNPYDDPRNLLESLLFHSSTGSSRNLAHSSPFSSLNELYMQIMRSCPEINRRLMLEVLEDIFGCCDKFFRCVGGDFRRALATLDYLAGRVPGQGIRAIRGLHAVLRLSGTDDNLQPLSPYIHSSFAEFLLESSLSSEFAIDPRSGPTRILRGCLDCMSKITVESDPGADHLRFALLVWPSLFWYIGIWKATDVVIDEYPELLKKLLSTDLVACWIKAFISQRDDSPFRYDYEVFKNNDSNAIVPQSFNHVFETNPLVRQAVSHVVSSSETALLHFLSQTPDVWPIGFADSVINFLRSFDKGYGLLESKVFQVAITLYGVKPDPELRMTLPPNFFLLQLPGSDFTYCPASFFKPEDIAPFILNDRI